MGKAGKEKKKRKLQEEGPKPPVMSNGLVSLSSQPRPPVPHSGLVSANGRDAKKPKAPAHPDAPSSQCPTEARGSGSGGGASSSSSVSVSAFEVGVATKVLYQMAESPEEFRGKEFKGLRAALHALRQSPGAAMTLGFGSKELSPVQVVSDALRDERWQDALRALKKMRLQKIVPKLGAVCRWVRDCDAAGDGEDPQVLQVLDAVLRTADPPQIGMISSTAAAKESLKGLPSISQPSVRCGGRLLTYVDWDPLADQKPCERGETEVGKTMKEFQAMGEAERQEFRGRFSVCHTEKGADRKPPNRHDLSIFLSKENAISLDPSYSLTRRVSVPFIASSSAFFAADLLSSDEADALVKGAEAVGYSPDQPVGGSAVEKKSVLAHALVWMADEAMADEIWRRLKPLVMAGAQGGDTGEENRGTSRCVTADGAVPVGINRRMRFYRYVPGAVYRPHIDGAWPGSSIAPESGAYLYDGFEDGRWSRLTLLIYLNEDFWGGQTTFFAPAADCEGKMEARGCRPRKGCALVFPHGDAAGALLHEGSPVLKGAKYVVRSEILFKPTPSGETQKETSGG